ncbi:MAG: hypothetical protein VYB68_00210, partial [Candidatus Neomarinimicrobiota bacterium]|nr:hypothetical protein [Candidatus Neomarinimicrobiota bacterium]
MLLTGFNKYIAPNPVYLKNMLQKKSNTFNQLIPCIITILIFASFTSAQSSDRTQSISFYSGAGIPVSGLNDWYGSTPILGIQYAYRSNDKTDIIFEFHYQKYNHGSIEDRQFQWIIDYNYYSSSKSNAHMIW